MAAPSGTDHHLKDEDVNVVISFVKHSSSSHAGCFQAFMCLVNVSIKTCIYSTVHILLIDFSEVDIIQFDFVVFLAKMHGSFVPKNKFRPAPPPSICPLLAPQN